MLCLLASSMLLRLLDTIALRRLFSVVLAQGVPPRSPPNSASACIPSSSSDAMSGAPRSTGGEDTGFRFTLRVPGDDSPGLEEEDEGGRDSGGESSRSRIEFDARLSVGAKAGGSGFLIFLQSNKVRGDASGGTRSACSRIELWLCVIYALPHSSGAPGCVTGRISFLVNLGGRGTRHSRGRQVSSSRGRRAGCSDRSG